MTRTALVAGLAIGVGLGGAAMAQSRGIPPIPHAARALLVDHDDDKHQHGKNKHREQEDENDDEDHRRSRRSSAPGAWRDHQAPPYYYYYSPPPFSYATPYHPYAPYEPAVPAPPPVLPRPSARSGPQPGAASTESNRRDGTGSAAPTIQWVDPAPVR